jgi:hypothetical protein
MRKYYNIKQKEGTLLLKPVYSLELEKYVKINSNISMGLKSILKYRIIEQYTYIKLLIDFVRHITIIPIKTIS